MGLKKQKIGLPNTSVSFIEKTKPQKQRAVKPASKTRKPLIMKTRILTLLAIGISVQSVAQNVGIGTTSFTPDASSILELRSTDGGFLMPRMTEAQRDAISSPASGLMIYQTNNGPGYYYYDGSVWQTFGAGAADNFGNHIAQQNIVVGEGLGITDSDEDTKIQVEESTDEDYIRFDVAGTEAMLINSAQNVGIGVSSPSEKLHVDGNIRIADGGYLDDDASIGGNNDDWLRLNGYVEMKSNTDDYGLVVRDKDNNDYAGITQKDGYSYFSDSGTSADYFLRGDGANVDVRGDINVMGSDVYDNSGDLRLSGEDDVMITMDYNNNDSDNRAIRFGKNSMGSPTELARITETGRLGVGDVNPIANIQIYGNGQSGYTPQGVGASAGPELGFGRGGFYYGMAASIQMIDYNGYSSGLCFNVHRGVNYGGGGAFADNWPNDVVQAMTIRNTGNVGIGTGDPTNELDVVGTVEADGLKINAGAASGLVLTSDAYGNATWQPAGTSMVDEDGDTKIQVEESTDEDRIRFDVRGTEAMMINSNGRIGVGTNSPDGTLTVGGTNLDTDPILHLQSGNNNLSTNNGAQIAFGYNGTDNFAHFIQTRHSSGSSTNNAIDFFTANGSTGNNTVTSGSNHVMSLNGTNVGVGTMTPSAQLHTTGSVRHQDLAGSGTRMVVADASGNLSTQAIPSGGGGGASPFGVNGTGTYSTSSSSYSNVNNMSLTLPAGTYILQFNAEVDGTNSSSVSQFSFFVNGSIFSPSERRHEPDNSEPKTISIISVVTVNYTQTVNVRWRKESGSGTIRVGNRSFTAIQM